VEELLPKIEEILKKMDEMLRLLEQRAFTPLPTTIWIQPDSLPNQPDYTLIPDDQTERFSPTVTGYYEGFAPTHDHDH